MSDRDDVEVAGWVVALVAVLLSLVLAVAVIVWSTGIAA